MSGYLPMPAADMKAVVERGEYLAFSLPIGSIIAGEDVAYIKADYGGGARWWTTGDEHPIAGREIDRKIADSSFKVIRVGHEAVTP